jgi:hypothetical protein
MTFVTPINRSAHDGQLKAYSESKQDETKEDFSSFNGFGRFSLFDRQTGEFVT